MPTFSVDSGADSDPQTPPPPSQQRRIRAAVPSAQRLRSHRNTPPSASSTTTSTPPGVFRFHQSPSPAASAAATVPVPVAMPSFQFGEPAPPTSTAPTNGGPSFRFFHNISPSPSPQPSPYASPRQSSVMASPEAELARLTLNETPASSQTPPRTLQLTSFQFSSPISHANATASGEQSSRRALTASPAPGSELELVSYSVRKEQPPSHPFFTSQFQSALKGGLDIAKGIADMIQTMPATIERGPELLELLQRAERLRKFIGSDTRTVAVLGDSGEGQ